MADSYRLSSLKDRGSDILLKTANPSIYRLNSFRILELPVIAAPRDISSQIRKLDLSEKFGNNGAYERGPLYLNPSPNTETRQSAYQRLLDPESRLIDELFWFWPLRTDSPIEEDEALTALLRNDISSAISIWKQHEELASESYVSTHNLAILYHTFALDLEYLETIQSLAQKQIEQKHTYWNKAYSIWQILLKKDGFWQRLGQRIDELDDPRLTHNTGNRIKSEVPLVISSINAQLAAQAAQKNNNTETLFHLNLLNNSRFDKVIIDDALRRTVEPLRDRIKVLCANAEIEAKKSPEHADKTARNLIKETNIFLNMIDKLLPEGHVIRESVHDQIASQILGCAVSFGNKTDDHEKLLKLAKSALSISVSASVRQRIETNIETINNNLKYTTCWFCKVTRASNKAIVSVNMYSNVSRESTWTGTKVHWQRLTVRVPRCENCKSIHDRTNLIIWLSVICGIVLAFLIGAITNGWLGFLIFLIVTVTGVVVAPNLKPKEIEKQKHKLLFPDVQKLISQGWSVGDKPSGVN